jgi:HK97 family phage major capsid protein
MADMNEAPVVEDGGDESGPKMVAYKLLKDMGSNKAGDVVHLSEDIGDELKKCGMCEHAKEEDMNGEVTDEVEMGDEPVSTVSNSVTEKLASVVEKTVAQTIAKERAKQSAKPVAAAEVKVKPYKTTGSYVQGIVKCLRNPNDLTEKNKVMAYQNEAARRWNKMGVQVKSPLGINEGTNSQGGYLVNPQFSDDVYAIPHTQINLADMAEPIEAKSNVYNQRFINESSLANGSIFGGLNMVATAEGASLTSSLPAWSNVAFTLQKLAVFMYYTSEVIEDASYPLAAELDEYAKKAFLYGINTQIVQGSTLEGFLNTPALVTVTSSTNDTAWHTTPSTALTYADIANMWAQVYPDCKTSPKGVWLYHPSLDLCLSSMTYTFSGANPAWGLQYDAQKGLEGNGSGAEGSGAPHKLFGKDAFPCWACSAPGVAGDILYVDFGTVRNFRKPFRVEVSSEYQFGTDQIAIRFINRLDCRTIFRNKVTGPNGTQSFSAIVTRSGSGT